MKLTDDFLLAGRSRYLELASFAALGERAMAAKDPEVALFLSAASRGHAWRAMLFEDLLPVSTGLATPGELTRPAHEAIDVALRSLVQGDDDAVVAGLAEGLWPALDDAYRQWLGVLRPYVEDPFRRTLRRVLDDLAANRADAPPIDTTAFVSAIDAVRRSLSTDGGPLGVLASPESVPGRGP